jgi:hypothetical protein
MPSIGSSSRDRIYLVVIPFHLVLQATPGVVPDYINTEP